VAFSASDSLSAHGSLTFLGGEALIGKSDSRRRKLAIMETQLRIAGMYSMFYSVVGKRAFCGSKYHTKLVALTHTYIKYS